MLPYLWVNLPDYLSSRHMEVKTIRGDGFCFLSAVAKVLEFDHKMTIPVQKAMEKIIKFLCENFEKYTAYHQQKTELPAGDTLISDVIEFFSSRNYNTNIVDLLMANNYRLSRSGPKYLPEQLRPDTSVQLHKYQCLLHSQFEI